jgi:hypothetical protein
MVDRMSGVSESVEGILRGFLMFRRREEKNLQGHGR